MNPAAAAPSLPMGNLPSFKNGVAGETKALRNVASKLTATAVCLAGGV
jgi:hypothetical protein